MISTKLLVKAILEKAEHYEWTLQGFGMLRTYLDRETRIHVWDKRFQIENVTMIHDHPWNFDSEVIVGEMINTCYGISHDADKPTHYRNAIKCGAGACTLSDPEYVSLYVKDQRVIDAGNGYNQYGADFHYTDARIGTVTIVSRKGRLSGMAGDVAHTAWPVARGFDGWVSAEPRIATPEEVETIVSNSLDKYFK